MHRPSVEIKEAENGKVFSLDTPASMSSYRICCLIEEMYGQSATVYQEKKGMVDQFVSLW